MVKLGVTKKSVDPTKEPSDKESAARCDKAWALLIGGGDSIQVTKVPVARTLRRLNQHQLEVFNAIVSSGSITGAARLLHISQPAVSRSLSNLEREIGFALFKRDKNGSRSRPKGRASMRRCAAAISASIVWSKPPRKSGSCAGRTCGSRLCRR
jgi:hypothetical protein